jgi:hypothetical protein
VSDFKNGFCDATLWHITKYKQSTMDFVILFHGMWLLVMIYDWFVTINLGMWVLLTLKDEFLDGTYWSVMIHDILSDGTWWLMIILNWFCDATSQYMIGFVMPHHCVSLWLMIFPLISWCHILVHVYWWSSTLDFVTAGDEQWWILWLHMIDFVMPHHVAWPLVIIHDGFRDSSSSLVVIHDWFRDAPS